MAQKKSLKAQQKHPQTKPFQIVPTIHKDCTERLMQINPALAKQARMVLDVNKSERHIRGGLATKEKYLHQQPMK
ncbi:MAG: sporulation transcriptional regulator SpoIIID [Lachnospiraceae bacterium]|nr:sporulation transcriptional regulator SpoIIID [Lachnospiraceae bacterium]